MKQGANTHNPVIISGAQGHELPIRGYTRIHGDDNMQDTGCFMYMVCQTYRLLPAVQCSLQTAVFTSVDVNQSSATIGDWYLMRLRCKMQCILVLSLLLPSHHPRYNQSIHSEMRMQHATLFRCSGSVTTTVFTSRINKGVGDQDLTLDFHMI